MRLGILMLFFVLTGCGATIQTYERLSHDTGRELSTHVGGQVFRVQRTQDLMNAFGKADVFGGKVNRGYIELRYQGLTEDGRLVFRLTEVETESTETTMSRYGGSTSTINAQRIGNSVYGTVTTYNTPRGITNHLPPNTTEFAVDSKKNKEFIVGGVEVQIISFTEIYLAYKLGK
jgi:hypothetical protein